MTADALPPPGWYPDPSGTPQERFWDGALWTEGVRSQPAVAPTAGRPLHLPGPLASFGDRLLAVIIDGLILVTAILVLMGVFGGIGFALMAAMGSFDAAGPGIGGGILLLLGFVLFIVLALVVPFAYQAELIAGPHGATIGKAVMGIEVVDTRDGGRLTRGRAWGRVAVYNFASTQILYLGCLWMLWDDQQRTWHDMIVESHVVRRQGPKPSVRDLFTRG